MGWAFKPRLIPSLIAVLFVCLFISLGLWQLDRAEQKLALSQQYEQRIIAQPLDLAATGKERLDKDAMYWRPVILRGKYDIENFYLLDNKTLSGRAGNYLYARFVLADGAGVLVNRGWLPQNLDRSIAPTFLTPEQELILTGVIKPPPRSVLLGQHVPEQLTPNVTRVQEVVIDNIAQENDWQLMPYIVRLEPPAPDGLHRIWQKPGFGRDKHLGYAFQWFAMATALILIYLFLTIKRDSKKV